MENLDIESMKWLLGIEAFLILLLVSHLTYFFLRNKNLGVTILLFVTGTVLILLNFSEWALLPEYPVWKKWIFLVLFFLIALSPYLKFILRKFFMMKSSKGWVIQGKVLDEIIRTCSHLSQAKTGALIAIERHDDLESWIEKGVQVDANLNTEILTSLFARNTLTHDGGVIIKGSRIAACGVIFPLNHASVAEMPLGTRHRAAIAFSEETDALVISVSEETGKVSLASYGTLHREIPLPELKHQLKRELV